MKIAFHSNQLGMRGTEVALFDYAKGNRDILGNESIIITNKNSELTTLSKFDKEFEVFFYDDFKSDVPGIIESENVDAIYYIKSGEHDDMIVDNATNLIHAVFNGSYKHGDKYACVSKWLGDQYNTLWVPHMVNLPKIHPTVNYRESFGIEDKFVVGWYGGNNFDIEFARDAVIDVANKRDDIVFIFMNHDPFCKLDNVMFIDPTHDLTQKVAFINTFDIMLHGRHRGETFGLTVAEASSLNKPVVTFNGSQERNHIDILGSKGLYYESYDELYSILMNTTKDDIKGRDWNCYKEFTPDKVMEKFKEVFLC